MESKNIIPDEISVLLPDGRKLIAQAFQNTPYPCINIYLQTNNGDEDEICFAELIPIILKVSRCVSVRTRMTTMKRSIIVSAQ